MDVQLIIPLLSLIALEAVLGIDNVIFISILAGKLPPHQQKKARQYGLILAGVLRLGLLAIIAVIMRLDSTLFTVMGHDFSGKDIVLLLGGLFLLYKSTSEIYHKVEGETIADEKDIKANTFSQVIVQILIMDLVFSIDSIITAIGLVQEIWIMYVAVIVTVILMLFAAETISNFVNRHPSFKMLALSFLLLIGFSLVGEGLGLHIPKGYIYFSMAFSLLVDVLQMKMNKKSGTTLPLDSSVKSKEK
ncbi:TerC family protein [Olivibacter sp. SDN3]|uniref:TerC family protein n=1 Tax=Olivibacter sp. SDN3 TaxID=2764720 RepID=UPI0016519F56|nr:TerC family protein [Olivibacter sp. SDN3]QNL49544.1 TerC family protein [Olivibacter sp. SDN3]